MIPLRDAFETGQEAVSRRGARDAGRSALPSCGAEDLVRLARRVCDAAGALLCLGDGDEARPHAASGILVGQERAGLALLRLADGARLHVVPDLAGTAAAEVASPVRFYAAVTLAREDGDALGTLAVADDRPRPGGLADEEAAALMCLARQAAREIELRAGLAAPAAGRAAFADAVARTQAAAAACGGDVPFLASWTVAGAMEAIGGCAGGVLAVVEDGALVIRGGAGDPQTGAALAAATSLFQLCLADDRPMRAALLRSAAPASASASAPASGVALLAPVRRAGKAAGVLALHAAHADAFSDDDPGLLLVFAGIAAAGFAAAMSADAVRAPGSGEARIGLAPDATLALGWFDWNIAADRLQGAGALAPMFGLASGDEAGGVALGRILRAIHPGDRGRIAALIRAGRIAGGDAPAALDAEFRLGSGDAALWVRAWGRRQGAGAPGGDRLSGILIDTTEEKRARRRQEALATLGDRLRGLGSAADLVRVASGIAADALGAARVGYAVVDPGAETIDVPADWCGEGVASVAGPHRFRDFATLLDSLRTGGIVVVGDVAADPRTRANTAALRAYRIGALLNMPVFERGRLVGISFVHHPSPHAWTDAETVFVRAVTDRLQTALARNQAEDAQRLRNQELLHRLKNTLSMVQAIATQTLRNTPDPAVARDVLGARLAALGKAHDLLMSDTGRSAEIGAVIAETLRLHDDGAPGRLVLEGPPVTCGEKAALSLGLVIHELATNAAKYGALSVPGGSVSVRWEVRPSEAGLEFHLAWTERGGPPVAPPSRRGFGSRLIEHGLTGAVGGSMRLDHAPDGVRCVFSASLARIRADDQPDG